MRSQCNNLSRANDTGDLGDDREHFVIRVVEVWRDPHTGIRPIVDHEVTADQPLAHPVSVRDIDCHGPAALGRISWSGGGKSTVGGGLHEQGCMMHRLPPDVLHAYFADDLESWDRRKDRWNLGRAIQ